MFREEIDMAGNAAKKKIQFLRQQTGAYFISAMLAGMFVGFGVLLAFTAGLLFWFRISEYRSPGTLSSPEVFDPAPAPCYRFP